MCVATPVQVKKVDGQKAIVDPNIEVDLSLMSEKVKPGDWLMCHQGLAINKLNPDEVQDILDLARRCGHNHE